MSRNPLAEIISHSAARAAKSSEVEMPRNGNTERAYLRTLPGGGYVAIDVSYVRRVLRRGHYRGVVVVERRADGDRHRTFAPIVIARATGRTIDSVVHQLLPAAECNPAIGAALLRCVPTVVPAKPLGVRRPRIVHNVPA